MSVVARDLLAVSSLIRPVILFRIVFDEKIVIMQPIIRIIKVIIKKFSDTRIWNNKPDFLVEPSNMSSYCNPMKPL